MRRTIGAVGATLTAAGLILGATGLVARAASAQTSQANAALRYLYLQVGADGSVAPAFGPGATEDTVISVADNGYDPATLKSPSTGTTTYHYLSAQASSITTAGGAAKYVLAWLAAGKPSAVPGAAQLAKLNAAAPGGYLHANGAFRASSEPANVYTQSLAVLADVGAGLTPTPAETGWLTCAQRADGGFGTAINDSAAAPPASGCGDTHGSDTNATSMALQALGAAGVSAADTAAKTYLHGLQDADGGFPFNAGSGSDPNSDDLVIQALIAIAQDPTGPAWTVGVSKNALSNLESFADAAGSGGYVYPGNSAPDAFTTSAVPQALALKPYGATTSFVPGTSPPAPSPATPSPSPTGAPAITVPDTGAAHGVDGGSIAALVLLGFGSAVLMCALPRGWRRIPS